MMLGLTSWIAVSIIVRSRVVGNGETVLVRPCPFCTAQLVENDGGADEISGRHLLDTDRDLAVCTKCDELESVSRTRKIAPPISCTSNRSKA